MKGRLAVLMLILILGLLGCRESIVHNLSETEANKIMTRLIDQQLEARKQQQADGKWSLSLPNEQAVNAIKFLAENRLLKDDLPITKEKSGLMMSREDQRFRYERALSREIESTLSGIAGVLQARVHLNLPIIDPLFGQSIDTSKSSASVLLLLGDQAIDKAEVISLVSGASGIPVSTISVMLSKDSENHFPLDKNPKARSAQISLAGEQAKVSSKAEIATAQSSFRQLQLKFFSFPFWHIGVILFGCLFIIMITRLVNRPAKLMM